MGNEGSTKRSKKGISQQILYIYKMYQQACLSSLKQIDQRQLKQYFSQYKDISSSTLIKQLFEGLSKHQLYNWSEELQYYFEGFFKTNFKLFWMKQVQEFYQLLLINSGVKNISPSYREYFYKHGPGKPMRTISLIKPGNSSAIKAINSSILNQAQQFFPQCSNLVVPDALKIAQSCYTKNDLQSSFIQLNQIDLKKYKSEINLNHNIENSSLVISQTVFVDRLTNEEKAQIDQCIKFYRSFANTVQQVINSGRLISCPFKHFDLALKQKVKRKGIKKVKKSNKNRKVQTFASEIVNSNQSSMSEISQIVDYQSGFAKYTIQERRKRQKNNNTLLQQLRCFTQAYAQFIWKYLQLFSLQQSYLGKLVTVDTVYSIVMKDVWAIAGWIGERGFEWEDYQAIKIIEEQQYKKKTVVTPIQMERLYALLSQKNPQKYLKKMVIFYRELSKKAETADQLLDMLEKGIRTSIQQRRHWGIFRMQNIIQKIVKIDETNGQICYAWTSWSIVIEMLKNRMYDLFES